MCAAWVLFCHSALRLFTCVSTRTARKHTNLAICNIAWVGNNSRFSQAKKKQFSRKHIFLVLLHFTSSYEYDTLYWMGRKSKKNIVSHLTISTRLININRTWVVWQQRPEKICLSFRQKKSGRQENEGFHKKKFNRFTETYMNMTHWMSPKSEKNIVSSGQCLFV